MFFWCFWFQALTSCSASAICSGVIGFFKQDIEQAVRWYTRAADQGLLEAQADLGFLYAKRENKVPEDFLIAYKWLTLAIQQGDRMAPSDLDELKKPMTPEQIAEAEQLVKAWNQKHQKNMES